MARVKVTKEGTTFINLTPKQLTREGVTAEYRGKAGKRRDFIVVESNPLEVSINNLRMSAGIADALRNIIVERIGSFRGQQSSKGTIGARKNWKKRWDRGDPMATYRFAGPKKLLSKEEKKEWKTLGNKPVRELKGSARPDDPPNDSEKGKYNHSGRLREAMAVRYRKPGSSRATGVSDFGEWHIFSAANRLNGKTGNIQLAQSGGEIFRGDVKAWPVDDSGRGKTYSEFLTEFSADVLSPPLHMDPKFSRAVQETAENVVKVLRGLSRAKQGDVLSAARALTREIAALYRIAG